MKNNSKFSRRNFISSMAAAGAGSALSAFRVPEITDPDNGYGELDSTEVSEDKSNNILLKRLIPQPEHVDINDDNEVKFDNTLKINIELDHPEIQTKGKVSDIFKQYFGTYPVVSVIQKSGLLKGEAYKIYASDSTLTISAFCFTGIRYAFSTLRQLAEANSGTEKLVCYCIPETKIEDSPAMSFRGLHLCWFPETEAIQIEQYLRWAAYYKFNYVVIEFWGTYPFISHPLLSWEEYKASPKDIHRLVKIGKELGVTLIPQLNIFGHASGSRGSSGKHTILDFHPEYQPLFEPDGWVWCLSNPETRRVLSDIVLEMLEAFDNPPYYHVGADEAWGAAECRLCRHSDYEALVLNHLNFFHNLLAERNCRMMMWHDMLIQKTDPRWKGYVSNGNENAEKMLNALPKDIIICDWQYGAPKKNETWPTMTFFKELGFDVLACPWNNVENIKSLGKKAGDARLNGMLCTTWHAPSRNELLNIMMYAAQAVWSKPPYANCNRMMGMNHLRQIGWDIPVKKYKNCGISEWQVRPGTYPE